MKNGTHPLVEIKKQLSSDCKNKSNMMKCDTPSDVSNNITGERGMSHTLV